MTSVFATTPVSACRRFPVSVLSAAIISLSLASCGDPSYKPPPIVVAFAPGFVPPLTLNTGAYAGIAATVTNDTHNGGVIFSCAPTGACGTFTPATTASQIPTCYLAPATVPSGNMVIVTATSQTDTTKSISAMITIANGDANPCP